jgi:hypothetical protein
MCDRCQHHHNQDCDCEGQCNGCDCGCGECGCEEGGHFHRRYQTKEEQIAELEAYLGKLKLETQAVEEHLAELRK